MSIPLKSVDFLSEISFGFKVRNNSKDILNLFVEYFSSVNSIPTAVE